jgi:peptide/nickel transport system substrate-binding protein
VLAKPYPKMLLALAKNSTPMAFIMPERLAKTDPFKQIDEYVGSGPMKFAKGEWVPGAKAVFEKFADYVPREEPASWLAGGKKMLVDRIEWIIMPDPATASAALQNGEVDWWENPISDLVPVLRKNRNVAVDIADPLGNIGTFRMNHLHPPFNDVRARRAVLMALDQEEYMRALVGDDNSLWKPLPGYFTPGTPLYNEDGGDILKGKRDIAAAKKLLAESGYTNQPVTCVVAQDQPITKGQGDVTAELLKRIGMNVDFVATDWGTTGQRRAQKSPPGQGGWAMFHSWHAGSDCINPAVYRHGAWFGWPNVPDVEKEVTAWFDANLEPAAPGASTRPRSTTSSTRRPGSSSPTGVAQERLRHRQRPLPFFWGVSKTGRSMVQFGVFSRRPGPMATMGVRCSSSACTSRRSRRRSIFRRTGRSSASARASASTGRSWSIGQRIEPTRHGRFTNLPVDRSSSRPSPLMM